MKNTQTDKATARPWSIHKQHHRMRIISRSGEPGQSGFRLQHITPDWREQKSGAKRGESPSYYGFYPHDEANAALIVKAVNEYEALCAVAVAANVALDELSDGRGLSQLNGAKLQAALATLASIRKGAQ